MNRAPRPWLSAVLLAVLVFLPLSVSAGMTPEEVKTFNENKAKAENGSASSQSLLGYYYNNGLGVAKNNVQAVYWFRKAAAQGDTYAEYILGMRYAIGDGVVKDVIEAYAYLSLAGKTDEARSLETKMTPDQIATGQNRALELKKEIAAANAAASAARLTPEEVKTFNENKAKAERGDRVAQFNLGYCYRHGEGVAKDAEQAVKWWRKAAEQGHIVAQNNLGGCYTSGHGVAKDLVEAVKWNRKAAEQGYAYAQYKLGNCYADGEGVAKDGEQAVKWWRKAAEQGRAKAQYNLGNAYAYGRGVAQDSVEAYAYYNLAGMYAYFKADRDDARKELAIWEKGMSPDARLRGQQRSKELQKEIETKIAPKQAEDVKKAAIDFLERLGLAH